MSKKFPLLMLFLVFMFILSGCLGGNNPNPPPKGDTLTQEQLNQLFWEALFASAWAYADLLGGPPPAALMMGSLSVKPTLKQQTFKASAYTL